jgi:hypothetical protein
MRQFAFNLVAVASISLCALTMTAQSQKQRDFEEADKADPGCNQIPYSDLRSNCQDQGRNVHEWCDGDRGPVSCNRETEKILNSIMSESRTSESLQQQRRDLNDKRDHASDNDEKDKYKDQMDAVDKQIETSNRQIDDLKRSLDNRKDFVDKTMETINKCINYRQAVMNVFGDALDKVRGEGDDDASLRPLAQSLKGKYQVSKSGHEEVINNLNTALEKCRKERP